MWSQTSECSALNQPIFEDDPGGYFDWLDGCMSSGGGVVDTGGGGPSGPPPCTPKTYTLNGRCWEIVCTASGPEVRPCFKLPRPTGNLPVIVAIRITGSGFDVQTQSAKGLQTEHVKHGQIKLKDLGSALVHGEALPEPAIKDVKSEFWKNVKPLVTK